MIVLYTILSILVFLLLVVNQKNYWGENNAIQLGWKREIVIILTAVSLSLISIELQKHKKDSFTQMEIGSLNHEVKQLNFIDRVVAGRWDIEAKSKGKVFKNIAIYILPISLLFFATSFKRRWALFLVFSEGYVLTESLTGIVKGLVIRYRPFAYKTTTEVEQLSGKSIEKFLEDISSYDIQNSFFSGDVSITAFGFMLFAFCYPLFYSNTKLKNAVYTVAVFCILLECHFRALSGKHFPSDVAIGALFGVLVAYLIVKLHGGQMDDK